MPYYRLRDGWLLLLRLLNRKRFLRPLQGSQPGEVFLFTAIWSLKMMKKMIRENKNQKAAQSVSVSSAVVSSSVLLLAPVSVLALVILVILIQIIIIPIESPGMV